MDYILNGIHGSIDIIISMDVDFLKIVFVSVKVSFISTLIASFLGVPFGVMISQLDFRGKTLLENIISTLMALPTVVVGLAVYAFISRRGPFGEYGLLFTQTAMVIGQVILAFPIIAGLTIAAINSLDKRIVPTAQSLGADHFQCFQIMLREARPVIMGAVIAGFGRVFSEVGVSMMLGGNIKYYTRNITTAIALETSRGEFSLGIALGIVLLLTSFSINIIFRNLRNV